MSYKVLYRKYRPNHFSEVVGQEIVIRILTNAVKENKISHAYLFFGPKGTGKTTIARLFAKAINCEKKTDTNIICNKCSNCDYANKNNHPDIIELDAASNNGIDNIRDIVENIVFVPIKGKNKIYIIDEAHMLSTSAFNALLKTLEEPHENVIFILITTEIYKIIPTIASRCQKFNFTKIENTKIKEKIFSILKEEKIDAEEKAINIIVEIADGCLRDALTLLEQAIIYSRDKITEKDILELFSIVSEDEKIQLLIDLNSEKIENVLKKIDFFLEKGFNCKFLIISLIDILKEVLLYKITFNSDVFLTKISKENAKKISDNFSEKRINEIINILLMSLEQFQTIQNYKLLLELIFIKLFNLNKKKEQISKIKIQKNYDNDGEFFLNDYELIKIMSKNDKNERNKLQEKWQVKLSCLLKTNIEEEQKRIIFLLFDSQPFVINEKNLIITSQFDFSVHEINKKKEQEIVNKIIYEITGKNIFVYAISEAKKEELKKIFLQTYKIK